MGTSLRVRYVLWGSQLYHLRLSKPIRVRETQGRRTREPKMMLSTRILYFPFLFPCAEACANETQIRTLSGRRQRRFNVSRWKRPKTSYVLVCSWPSPVSIRVWSQDHTVRPSQRQRRRRSPRVARALVMFSSELLVVTGSIARHVVPVLSCQTLRLGIKTASVF
jgi:hypothetical protein